MKLIGEKSKEGKILLFIDKFENEEKARFELMNEKSSELILYDSLEDNDLTEIYYKIHDLESQSLELNDCFNKMTVLECFLNKAFEFGREFERGRK